MNSHRFFSYVWPLLIGGFVYMLNCSDAPALIIFLITYLSGDVSGSIVMHLIAIKERQCVFYYEVEPRMTVDDALLHARFIRGVEPRFMFDVQAMKKLAGEVEQLRRENDSLRSAYEP